MDYKTCMENRPMKPAKQQKIIYDKFFKSDILNEKSGYFKTEKIFKVTPKPNESRPKVKEYVPKYSAINPKERRQIDLLDAEQKLNLKMNLLNLNNNNINPKKKLRQIINDNCYDDKGIFSARKRLLLEFYGMEQNYEEKLNKTVRYTNKNNKLEDDFSEDDDKSRVFSETKKKNYDNIKTTRNKKPIGIYKKYLTAFKPLNEKKKEEDFINLNDKNKDEKRQSIGSLKNSLCSSVKIEKNYDNKTHKRTSTNISQDMKYFIDFNKVNNNYYNFDKDKTNLIKNMTKNKIKRKFSSKTTEINKKNNKKSKPVIDPYISRNNNFKRYKKTLSNAKKNNDNKNYYNIEIGNKASLLNNNGNSLYDIKTIKEIFYNNGIHAYDIRDDSIKNIFGNENKINLKIRKDKDDPLFDENYEKAVLELNKLKAEIKKFENDDAKYAKKKKRQGTPGIELKRKNKEDSEEERKVKENKEMNKGNIHQKKRDIAPVVNSGYKNNYYYQYNFFRYKKV